MNATCVTCGATFVVIERHPMITNDQWCPSCTETIRERIAIQGIANSWNMPGATRADDV